MYYDGESVSGKVSGLQLLSLPSSLFPTLTFRMSFILNQVIITLKKPGSKLEHQGIKIEFIGQIELYYDRGNHHEFVSLVKELARPGELNQHSSCYNFEFVNVEKTFESYTGANVRLRFVNCVVILFVFVEELPYRNNDIWQVFLARYHRT